MVGALPPGQVHRKIPWKKTVHVFPCTRLCLQEQGNDKREPVDGQEEKSGALGSSKTKQTVRWVPAVVHGPLEAFPFNR